MISTLAVSAFLLARPFSPFVGGAQGAGPQTAKVTLARKWSATDKLRYNVRGVITSEDRQVGLITFLPDETTLDYNFSVNVNKMKVDGVADVNYSRPVFNIITDDPEKGAKRTTLTLNQLLQFDISPVNELLEMKDLTPKPKKPEKNDGALRWVRQTMSDGVALGLVDAFLGELQSLALFAGPIGGATIDLEPKLPLDPIAVGGTWKRTVGYSPQRLAGSGSKQAVQRLDFQYTYEGKVKDDSGKTFERITALMSTKTDLAEYAVQLTGGRLGEGIVRKVPLDLTMKLRYDLDPNTMHTVKGRMESKGSYGIYVRGNNDAVVENRFSGITKLTLLPSESKKAPKKSGNR